MGNFLRGFAVGAAAMIFALYLLYAFVQAVLVERYGLKDPEVFASVMILMLLAPLISMALLIGGFIKAVEWLARPN